MCLLTIPVIGRPVDVLGLAVEDVAALWARFAVAPAVEVTRRDVPGRGASAIAAESSSLSGKPPSSASKSSI